MQRTPATQHRLITGQHKKTEAAMSELSMTFGVTQYKYSRMTLKNCEETSQRDIIIPEEFY